MANIYGTLNPKGKGGGSETSGCYLLENASTMTHLYAYTYEGLLRDIDNRNDFPLKNGDTLIGDDNFLYKLMTIDEDLGTFTAVQFWKLDSPTPTIEITFDQAISSDTYSLDSDQFGLIQNNEVVKVDLYSESELLTFVKKSDDGSNIVMGTIITYDSNNSEYVYKEAVINKTSYEMTITDMTLSSGGGGGGGKQLYQHNITYTSVDSNYYFNCSIITDSDTQFTLASLHQWLNDNGFTSITGKSIVASGKQASYQIWGVAYNNSTTIFLFSSASGGQAVSLTQAHSIKDTVIAL